MKSRIICIICIGILVINSLAYSQDFFGLTLEEKILWLKNPDNYNDPEYPNRLLQTLPLKGNEDIYFDYLNEVGINELNKKVFTRYLNEVDYSKNSEIIANKFLKDAKKLENNIVTVANKFLSGKINGNVDVSIGNVEYIENWKIKNGNIELDLNNEQFTESKIKSLSKGGFEITPKQNLKLNNIFYNLPEQSKIIINNDYSVIVPRSTEILPQQGGKIIVEDSSSKIKFSDKIEVRNGFIEYFKDNKIIRGRDFDIYFNNGRYSGNYVAIEDNAFTLQGKSSISIRNNDGLYNTYSSINKNFGFESTDSIKIKPFGSVEKTNIPSLFSDHQMEINGKKELFKFKYITDGKDFLPKPSVSIGSLGEHLNTFSSNNIKIPGVIMETKYPLMLNDREFTFNLVKHFLGNEPIMDNYKFITDSSNNLREINMFATKLTEGGILDINTKFSFDTSKFVQPNLKLNFDEFGKNDMLRNSLLQEEMIKNAIANNALKIETRFELKSPFIRFISAVFGSGNNQLRQDMLININSANIKEPDLSLFKNSINNYGLGKTLKVEGMDIYIDNQIVGRIRDPESISRLVIYLLNR